MREELLQFIWSAGLFNQNHLTTTDGEVIRIHNRGTLNNISGPDFSTARISIGDSQWAGNVEIHVKASEWNHHKHQFDAAYTNVILHVVFEHDADVRNKLGDKIPSLELSGRISRNTLLKYDELKRAQGTIPCANYFEEYPKIHFNAWLDRLLVERLERKAHSIELNFKHSKKDWLQTFYTCLVSYLGQNQNKLAFEELAHRIPYALLSKYKSNENQVQALLFGAAGLIPDTSDKLYVLQIREEWTFLKEKHNLSKIASQWKFGGVRPDAFPTRRIFILSRMIANIQSIYAQVMNVEHVQFSKQEQPHEYWKHRYHFTSDTPRVLSSVPSKGLQDLLVINAIAPFTFFYGQHIGSQRHIDHAVKLLEHCQTESNTHTKTWSSMGYKCSSASDSQSIIELTTQYCMHKNCVLCPIGKTIMTKQ